MKQLPRKILVIRFSSIGDIVLTTPVVRCLKRQINPEIHYLTKAAYAPAIRHNPHIDKIHLMTTGVREVLPALRQENFDLVVDLHRNLRSHHVRTALGVRAVACNKLNFEKWLLVNLKINRLPDVHIVDRYLDTVARLGVHNDGEGLDFFVPDDDFIAAARPGVPYAALALGAGLPTKNLETGQQRKLIEGIRSPVVLLGGPEDEERGRLLESEFEHAVNFAGSTSLGQSAALVRDASVLITPDTGLMHIGAAFSVPILSVWGNTVPEFGMTPYYPQGHEIPHQRFEVRGLKCRPCSKIGYQKCPRGHFRCIRELNLDMIAHLANSWVELTAK